MREMTTQEIQSVSLDILKDVHQFCIEHNITYTMQGGSLIGAVRHKGFIPWDDDIDIAMPRPDYNRFIHTYCSKNGYKVFSRELPNSNNVLIAYARICDMENTYVDDSAYPWNTHTKGVWIDLFPLDGVESSLEDCIRRTNKLKKDWRKGSIKRRANLSYKYGSTLSDIIKCIFRKLVAPFLSYKSIDNHILLCKQISWDKAEYYSNLSYMFYGIRERHRKKVIEETIIVPYENIEVCIMKGYDEALKEKYGNYMQLPPIEKRIAQHDFNKYYWK